MERATWRRRSDGVHVIVRHRRGAGAMAVMVTMAGAFALVAVLSALLTASLVVVPAAVVAGLTALAVRALRRRRAGPPQPPVELRARHASVVPFRRERTPAGARPA